MSTTTGVQTSRSEFEKMVRDIGVVVLHCDVDGSLKPDQKTDWLIDLLISSPIVRVSISTNCKTWNTQDKPDLTSAFPGVWFAPVRLGSIHRCDGYKIGVIVTDVLLSSEYFHALCQASDADATIVRELTQSLPPVAPQDVERIATLFQYSWNTQNHLETDQQTIASVGRELADSYEEISLLYTITSSMNSVNHPERFIELACNELLETLPYAWIGVQLRTGDRLPRLGSELVIAGSPDQKPLELAHVVQSVSNEISPSSGIVSHGDDLIVDCLGPATIIEPIVSDGKVIGVLVAAHKQGDDGAASSVDIKLLSATAAQLAIFLENALLYEDLNATFLGTLEALTASIDAKDRYTCGHSKRVALLTSQLARAAGIDEDQIDRFRIAGLVHDIGKIGVPEYVLLKKGDLSDSEYKAICKHPEIGARILRDIPQMEDVIAGVLHHHERFDGGGYPHAISSHDIPLVARMIALADTFDAMSSSRTYRDAMTRNIVLEEMKRGVGTQFDPALSALFFNLDFSEWEQLMIDHQEGVPNDTERNVA
ncbi:MAG: HD domain-containing phosphohydrolase [Planctomycetota bacterium]|nr:HD domain-containing phosphohydrolase [Planctomycetota bacterium]